MSEIRTLYTVLSPGPRDYHLALVDDWDGPTTQEQIDWLYRVRPVREPRTVDPRTELHALLTMVEIAERRPDLVTEASIFGEVAWRLRRLLAQVTA